MHRPEDVIFGSRALNYEEGKWTTAETFNADHNICSARGGEVARFIAAKRQEGYKHGDYISGCAVRMDADHIIARVKQAVSIACASFRFAVIDDDRV